MIKTINELMEFRDFLWDHLTPNMRLLFMMQAPDKYAAWKGNCCRQAATLCHVAAVRNLGASESSCVVIDRHITAIVRRNIVSKTVVKEKFIHSFLVMPDFIDSGEKRKYTTVDMSVRQARPIFVRWSPQHFYEYPHDLNEQIVGGCNQHGYHAYAYRDRLNEPEYYTGLTIEKIYEICLKSKPPTKETLNEIRQGLSY